MRSYNGSSWREWRECGSPAPSVHAPSPWLLHAHPLTSENHHALVVSVPVGHALLLAPPLGAARQCAVLLENFRPLLQPGPEREVAQGESRLQDSPWKEQLARRDGSRRERWDPQQVFSCDASP